MAISDTRERSYSDRLEHLQLVWWKRVLRPIDPWGWNLRRLRLGFVLDIGCGIGRNLDHVGANGVGVDHNPSCIAACHERGLRAYLAEDFDRSPFAEGRRFDSLLFAHVLEHVERDEAIDLVRRYVPRLKPAGRLIVITPQERGFASDATHRQFVDFDAARAICEAAGTAIQDQRSFPFPRMAGTRFIYNEFVTAARVAA